MIIWALFYVIFKHHVFKRHSVRIHILFVFEFLGGTPTLSWILRYDRVSMAWVNKTYRCLGRDHRCWFQTGFI